MNIFGDKNLIDTTTFPTLSKLFPQILFDDERTMEFCTKVDYLLAKNTDFSAGPTKRINYS